MRQTGSAIMKTESQPQTSRGWISKSSCPWNMKLRDNVFNMDREQVFKSSPSSNETNLGQSDGLHVHRHFFGSAAAIHDIFQHMCSINSKVAAGMLEDLGFNKHGLDLQKWDFGSSRTWKNSFGSYQGTPPRVFVMLFCSLATSYLLSQVSSGTLYRELR